MTILRMTSNIKKPTIHGMQLILGKDSTIMGMLMTIGNVIRDSKENSTLLNILKHSWEQYGNHGIQQDFREHIHSLMAKTFCRPLRT